MNHMAASPEATNYLQQWRTRQTVAACASFHNKSPATWLHVAAMALASQH